MLIFFLWMFYMKKIKAFDILGKEFQASICYIFIFRDLKTLIVINLVLNKKCNFILKIVICYKLLPPFQWYVYLHQWPFTLTWPILLPYLYARLSQVMVNGHYRTLTYHWNGGSNILYLQLIINIYLKCSSCYLQILLF